MSKRIHETAGKEDEATSERFVPDMPKSFSPYVRDPGAPNAWETLDSFSDGGTRGNSPIEEMFALARSHIKARDLRSRHLPNDMFGEPAWDMLLSLYVTFRSHAQQTVSNLCVSSGAPATTALRWIVYLERQKFVTRRNNPRDLRVVFIELTAAGRDAVEAYLASLLEQNHKGAFRI